VHFLLISWHSVGFSMIEFATLCRLIAFCIQALETLYQMAQSSSLDIQS
jgi:hypothetical protein